MVLPHLLLTITGTRLSQSLGSVGGNNSGPVIQRLIVRQVPRKESLLNPPRSVRSLVRPYGNRMN